VGTLDDYLATFGPDALQPTTGPGLGPHAWHAVCVCGHLQKHHSEDVGGLFELQPVEERELTDGRKFVFEQRFTGCRGAMVSKGVETIVEEHTETEELLTRTETFLATCPCEEFREVARVDRPNRYWNQRIPVNRDDGVRHPMSVGIRAFVTFLSRRRAALADPAWATTEFKRRFEWGTRRCQISGCTADGDGVWPAFVTDEGLSELRCAAHR